MSLGIFIFHHHILVAAHYKTEPPWGLRADCPTPHLAKGNSPCSSGFAISSQELCVFLFYTLSVFNPLHLFLFFPSSFLPPFFFFPPLSYWPLLLTLPHTTSFKNFFLDFPGSFSLSLFLSPLSVSVFFYNFKLFFATLFLNLCFFLPVSVFLSSCSHS